MDYLSIMSSYALRDALTDVLDGTSVSTQEVTDVLLTLLAAHILSEGLNPADVSRQLLVLVAVMDDPTRVA